MRLIGYPSPVIVHLNGVLVPRESARISPFDRGFLFGDAVYEGLRSIAWDSHAEGGVSGSRSVGVDLHVDRLTRGLAEARIACGAWDPRSLGQLTDELMHANGLRDAFVYWQVSRGTPSGDEPLRQRVPPVTGLRSGVTVFGFCSPQATLGDLRRGGPASKRCAVIADPRWSMGHLKSSSLIGNVISAIEGDDRGGDDAIFVRDGVVVEGLATNVLIVTAEGQLVTPSLSSAPMLAGVTRAILLHELKGEMIVRPVRLEELAHAREIMLTGSNTMVASVTSLVFGPGRNSLPVGDGSTGPIAKRLSAILIDAIIGFRDRNLPAALINGHAWPGFGVNEPHEVLCGDLLVGPATSEVAQPATSATRSSPEV